MVGILASFLLAMSTTALASSNESDLAVDTPAMKLSSHGAAVLVRIVLAGYMYNDNWFHYFSTLLRLVLPSTIPRIVPASDPDGPLLEDLGEQEGTNMTWTVNLSAGTSIILAIRDSEAVSIQSDVVQIQNSTDGCCLNE
ncbi:hypothetical protein EDD18DRAFT_1344234 [Armillaria luteobubalina]|uniref:Uncharacterized protein n=1 Tax=Armillaria luteobubalina TaxID=153913 RepID=A0AA39QP84_9AGAR|nr:hypothetical protein EDD18DRAFT_1344234 [Armillaria luteobubalina]